MSQKVKITRTRTVAKRNANGARKTAVRKNTAKKRKNSGTYFAG